MLSPVKTTIAVFLAKVQNGNVNLCKDKITLQWMNAKLTAAFVFSIKFCYFLAERNGRAMKDC